MSQIHVMCTLTCGMVPYVQWNSVSRASTQKFVPWKILFVHGNPLLQFQLTNFDITVNTPCLLMKVHFDPTSVWYFPRAMCTILNYCCTCLNANHSYNFPQAALKPLCVGLRNASHILVFLCFKYLWNCVQLFLIQRCFPPDGGLSNNYNMTYVILNILIIVYRVTHCCVVQYSTSTLSEHLNIWKSHKFLM
jgi:hypothetical protein